MRRALALRRTSVANQPPVQVPEGAEAFRPRKSPAATSGPLGPDCPSEIASGRHEVSGHDFSRAEKRPKKARASAPERLPLSRGPFCRIGGNAHGSIRARPFLSSTPSFFQRSVILRTRAPGRGPLRQVFVAGVTWGKRGESRPERSRRGSSFRGASLPRSEAKFGCSPRTRSRREQGQ